LSATTRARRSISLIGDIPYHHLPITKDTKPQQEAQIKRIITETGAELVVLARYMQILSDDLAAFLRALHQHPPLVPAQLQGRQTLSPGPRARGQDDRRDRPLCDRRPRRGPIIHQDVEPVSHADRPDDLVRKGRDIERRVLAEAVRLHLEDRALRNGNKTVVFRS
jgi:formyltetrahydrofolate deformylase